MQKFKKFCIQSIPATFIRDFMVQKKIFFQTFPTLMYPEAFFKMHDVTDDLVKNRKESKTHYGDFVDKIIEVCNDANSSVTEDMIKSQGTVL